MIADYQTIAIDMFVIGLAVTLLGMGALVAYYGSKKTRSAGFVFIVLGLISSYYLWFLSAAGPGGDIETFSALLAVIGGFAGAIIGIIIFLVAIIKS